LTAPRTRSAAAWSASSPSSTVTIYKGSRTPHRRALMKPTSIYWSPWSSQRGFKFLLGIFRRNFARLHRRALPVITSTARTVNAQGPAAPASHSPTPSALNFMAMPLAPYGAGIGRGGGGVGSDAGEGSLNRAREGARRARSPPAQLCAGADPKAWAGLPGVWRRYLVAEGGDPLQSAAAPGGAGADHGDRGAGDGVRCVTSTTLPVTSKK
jgi:hypothetical protein